jgi:Sec-independent protein translocase protein TatA
VVVFGGKLPDIARHFGSSLREFRQGLTESEEERRKSASKPDDKDEPPPLA